MSERHDEVEPDVASVVAEAVGAFGGETVRVLQTDHERGQRVWDGALIGQHTSHDPARGGAVTTLRFALGEDIELAASEVSAATFGRQHGDAHESLTVMTTGDVPALLLIVPQGALEAKYHRKTPPRSVLESDAVQRCETALSHLWATHGNHDLYVRDERTAGPEGAAAVEPIIGRFEGVGRDVEGGRWLRRAPRGGAVRDRRRRQPQGRDGIRRDGAADDRRARRPHPHLRILKGQGAWKATIKAKTTATRAKSSATWSKS
jgi:hypothetical protein